MDSDLASDSGAVVPVASLPPSCAAKISSSVRPTAWSFTVVTTFLLAGNANCLDRSTGGRLSWANADTARVTGGRAVRGAGARPPGTRAGGGHPPHGGGRA